jgi:uncharacterized protein YktB (UPF0637 family)
MDFKGFEQKDFDVFKVDGLEARMHELIQQVRPKLYVLGESLVPFLSQLTVDEMFAHVAKHARRKVHPPQDTWVAWSNNKRGYKMHPHFQVGLNEDHLFIWFAIIYEATDKIAFAHAATDELDSIVEAIPSDFVWSVDHTETEAIRHDRLSKDDLSTMLKRLSNVKKAELLCGRHIHHTDSLLSNTEAFIEKTKETFIKLAPLYRLACRQMI